MKATTLVMASLLLYGIVAAVATAEPPGVYDPGVKLSPPKCVDARVDPENPIDVYDCSVAGQLA